MFGNYVSLFIYSNSSCLFCVLAQELDKACSGKIWYEYIVRDIRPFVNIYSWALVVNVWFPTSERAFLAASSWLIGAFTYMRVCYWRWEMNDLCMHRHVCKQPASILLVLHCETFKGYSLKLNLHVLTNLCINTNTNTNTPMCKQKNTAVN
jgi:uncharacterized membrane protein